MRCRTPTASRSNGEKHKRTGTGVVPAMWRRGHSIPIPDQEVDLLLTIMQQRGPVSRTSSYLQDVWEGVPIYAIKGEGWTGRLLLARVQGYVSSRVLCDLREDVSDRAKLRIANRELLLA